MARNTHMRTFTWKADQLAQQDTCLLTNSAAHSPRTERFADAGGANGYDAALRLTHASRPAKAFATTGGAFGRRNYTYDALGNRRTATQDCWGYEYQYPQQNAEFTVPVDRLSRYGATSCECKGPHCPSAQYAVNFSYDAEGRTLLKAWDLPQLSAKRPGLAPRLNFDDARDTTGSGNAAVGAVYRVVDTPRGVYEYFYDANGRRRLKVFPSGREDEFFYDGDKLLEDRGLVTPATHRADGTAVSEERVLDEYVWLDGRPVALLKSRLGAPTPGNAALVRAHDALEVPESGAPAGDCTRNEEYATCGAYALVTDYLGKPVLMLDSAGRVAGAADYEPFGHVNRVTYLSEVHPLDAASRTGVLAYFNQKPGPNDVVQLRARFAYVDTDEASPEGPAQDA